MDIMDTYKISCILTNFHLPILRAYPFFPTIFSFDILTCNTGGKRELQKLPFYELHKIVNIF